MTIHERIFTSIAVLLALICLGAGLRRVDVFRREHGSLLARLATEVTLPALIFWSLATSSILRDELVLAGLMAGSVLAAVAAGWLATRLLRLEPRQTGALVLSAGFGSSGLLGYPLIQQIYPRTPAALTDAVMISEVGFAPLLFSLGVLIAIHYGAPATSPKDRVRAVAAFFRSPIFISLIAGLLYSFLLRGRDGPLLGSVLHTVHVVASANTLVVSLAVGLALRFAGLRRALALALPVVAIKLFLQPVLLWAAASSLFVDTWQTQVLVLQGAMPSALVSVVLAERYGCDGELASKLVFVTFVVSLGTLPALGTFLT